MNIRAIIQHQRIHSSDQQIFLAQKKIEMHAHTKHMYIVHEAVAGADKSKKTKEKMQMECSSVRKEMAC